ncbi:MAG: TolC family protein [Muribaculaceae bacterium]|nr:TolC family protein [Muribaculaceae bacterium]
MIHKSFIIPILAAATIPAAYASGATTATPDSIAADSPTATAISQSPTTTAISQTPAYDNTAAQSVTLSREECIRIALDQSPTIKVADLEVNRMEYAKKEAQGSLFPTIDFQAAYQRSIELQTIRMDMGGQSQSLKMGSDNTWNFGFNAQMPLVNPVLWKSISISKTQILAQMETARQSRLDLIDQINQAYYSLLLAIASKDVIQQNYDRALFNADLYKKRFEAGTASEYDVLRSSVQATNIEPELLQADISIRQCKLALKVLMGFDYNVDINPDTTLADMQREMYGYALGADTDLSGNSALRSLDIQTDIARKNVNLKKFAWIPTLGATFNVSWLSLSNGNALRNQEFSPYSNVGLALSVPIFSGGSKYYGLKQAKVQVEELRLQRENLLMQLTMQKDLAIDNINREVLQIASSEQGMKEARKAYDIMQKSFEIGAASYLDLRDSEIANTSAQLAYLQSIYNYLISTSELDLLLGKEDELR